jgi:5-hydroxyisourate hydrolase
MPGVSIHVVDVSRGVVAAGMEIALFGIDADGRERLIARGKASANGSFDDPALATRFTPGRYRAVFHLADYYRAQRLPQPAVPFLDVVTYDFGVAEPAQHYHLPFKCTPWGYSCFRGGA